MPVDSYTYIGRKACGCVVAATVDGDLETAKDVASFIRDGLVVERVATELLSPAAMGAQIRLGCKHSGKVGAALL